MKMILLLAKNLHFLEVQLAGEKDAVKSLNCNLWKTRKLLTCLCQVNRTDSLITIVCWHETLNEEVFVKANEPVLIQPKPLYVITLGQRETDHINQMKTIREWTGYLN